MSVGVQRWQKADSLILCILVFGSTIMFLPALGAAGILTSDAYYSSAAREMYLKNELLTPVLNDKPFFEKPILIYWLIIASYKIFGISTFAARLPSALCAIATVALLYALLRQVLNRRLSCFSALVLASTPLFAVVGHVALTDMPLTFFVTAANLLFLIALIKGQSRWALPAYVAMALAVLCKGPMALAIVLCCVGGYLLATCSSMAQFWLRIRSIHPLLGAFIFLDLVIPWFLFEHFATKGEFTKYFFIQQNIGRIAGNLPSHAYPWWFYLPFLLGGFLPWSLFLIHAPILVRNWKRKSHMRSRDAILLASCFWFVGLLVLLFLASSKLPSYLLPLAPPSAIIVAILLDTTIRLGKRDYLLWTAPVLLLFSSAVIPIAPMAMKNSPEMILPTCICLVFVCIGFVVYLTALIMSKIRRAVYVLFYCCIFSCTFFVPVSLIEEYRRGPIALHSFLQWAQKREDSNVAVLSKDIPSVSFYSKRKIFELEIIPRDCIEFLKTTRAPHYVIVETQFLPVVMRSFNNRATTMAREKNWNLLLLDEGSFPDSDSFM